MRTFARTAALLTAIAALAIPTATTAQAAPGPFGSPGDVITTPLQYALKALPIADEDRTGATSAPASSTGSTPTKTAATPAPKSSRPKHS
ncbi:hypothetical protein ACIHCV_45045 [Streptomyces sp. NPDC051956]|uniref:hypothetical protein n=1 Tax=Streptomyces sp. NPDC051956 TaxID=3365677 RepID=UPI0037D47AFB